MTKQTLEIVKQTLILNEYRHEYLIALNMEQRFNSIEKEDMCKPAPYVVLVYVPDKQLDENRYVYRYYAARIV